MSLIMECIHEMSVYEMYYIIIIIWEVVPCYFSTPAQLFL